jgi:hypothetical protein
LLRYLVEEGETMTGIDMTAQFGWLPTAMNALLMLSATAIAADVWSSRRRALRASINVRTPATVTAIVVGSHSASATADPAPSVTSLPEAA